MIDIIAIILLIIIIPIHIFPFSSIVSGVGLKNALADEAVRDRAKNPLYLIAYSLLLFAISYHSMYRFRLLLTEYLSSRRVERIITICCIVVGVLIFIYGIYTTILAYLRW